jgi:hypothetical protein
VNLFKLWVSPTVPGNNVQAFPKLLYAYIWRSIRIRDDTGGKYYVLPSLPVARRHVCCIMFHLIRSGYHIAQYSNTHLAADKLKLVCTFFAVVSAKTMQMITDDAAVTLRQGLTYRKRWFRQCHKTEGPGFDSRCGPCKFSSDLITLLAQPLTEMSTKGLPYRVKCGWRVQSWLCRKSN